MNFMNNELAFWVYFHQNQHMQSKTEALSKFTKLIRCQQKETNENGKFHKKPIYQASPGGHIVKCFIWIANLMKEDFFFFIFFLCFFCEPWKEWRKKWNSLSCAVFFDRRHKLAGWVDGIKKSKLNSAHFLFTFALMFVSYKYQKKNISLCVVVNLM